jgi:hypothetical protein
LAEQAERNDQAYNAAQKSDRDQIREQAPRGTNDKRDDQ